MDNTLTDEQIMDFFSRIADGMTTVADLDVLQRLLEQVAMEVTGNDNG